MISRDDLIFDREQSDIDFAMTLRQANLPIPETESLRFSYDWRALNRVEQYISQLEEYLVQYGYQISLPLKTWWRKEDQITWVESERYMANLKELADILGVNLVLPPVLDALPFEMANRIEKFLYDVDTLLEQTSPLFRVAGTFASGQASYLPQFID